MPEGPIQPVKLHLRVLDASLHLPHDLRRKRYKIWKAAPASTPRQVLPPYISPPPNRSPALNPIKARGKEKEKTLTVAEPQLPLTRKASLHFWLLSRYLGDLVNVPLLSPWENGMQWEALSHLPYVKRN